MQSTSLRSSSSPLDGALSASGGEGRAGSRSADIRVIFGALVIGCLMVALGRPWGWGYRPVATSGHAVGGSAVLVAQSGSPNGSSRATIELITPTERFPIDGAFESDPTMIVGAAFVPGSMTQVVLWGDRLPTTLTGPGVDDRILGDLTGPRDVLLSPDGATLWQIAATDPANPAPVQSIDTSSGTVTDVANAPPGSRSVAATDRGLWVQALDDSQSRIVLLSPDANSPRPGAEIAVGANAVIVAIVDQSAYVVADGGAEFRIVNLDTGTVTVVPAPAGQRWAQLNRVPTPSRSPQPPATAAGDSSKVLLGLGSAGSQAETRLSVVELDVRSSDYTVLAEPSRIVAAYYSGNTPIVLRRSTTTPDEVDVIIDGLLAYTTPLEIYALT